MKTLLASLLFIFMLCVPNLIGGQSFSTYSPLLDVEVYPNIQKYVDALNIKQPLTNDSSQKIASDVFDIMIKVLDEKQMISLSPPTAYVTKFKNEIRDVYFLNTIIVLFDDQQSIKNVCITSMLFEKRFLLFVDEKGKIEV